MTGGDKIAALATPRDQKTFTSQGALAQYISVNLRQDLCAIVQLVASAAEHAKKNEYKALEKTI